MKDGILISSPDLRPSLFSVLKGLNDESLLKQVVTTIAIDPDSIGGRLLKSARSILPSTWTRGIERRFIPPFLKGKVQGIHSREIIRLLAGKSGKRVFSHHVWLWAELGFDLKVAERYGGMFKCIYGMEHCSLESFKIQKSFGGLCILRQVMAHGQDVIKIMQREVTTFPRYGRDHSGVLLNDLKRSLARKETEYDLADLIVANSDFVKGTFSQAGFDLEKVAVIPTGCPVAADIPANAGKGAGPLIFLFVGSLSLRKGIPYLINAWKALSPTDEAQLWLVGKNNFSDITFKDRNAHIRFFGPLPRSQLSKIYEQADVFVLPTLLEGLAYSLLEALSYGLPVITTKESGCGNFVEDGRNGFIVEARNASMLFEKMAWCMHNRKELYRMGELSRDKARGWTAEDSNRAHLSIIRGFLKKYKP